MFYDRKICYLDYMENQERKKGTGFIKIEVRDTCCNLTIQVSGMHSTDNFSRPILLEGMSMNGERLEGMLCELTLYQGRGSVQLSGLHSGNMGKTGISYEQLHRIRIPIGAGKEISCRIRELHPPAETILKQAVSPGAEPIPERERQTEPEKREERERQTEPEKQAERERQTEPEKRTEWERQTEPEERAEWERQTEPEKQAEWERQTEPEERTEWERLTELEEREEQDNMAQSEIASESLQMSQSQPQAQPQPQGQSQPQARPQGQSQPQAWPRPQDQSQPQAQPRPQDQSQPQSQTQFLLLENKWKQLSAIYPHMIPFGDERDYLSLGPQDFVILPERYYRLANNSFLLHGYYNYKHLILSRLERRGEVRYYIGVPGNFYEREKQVAIMFGFESFECMEEPAGEGDYGYYMMRVEL